MMNIVFFLFFTTLFGALSGEVISSKKPDQVAATIEEMVVQFMKNQEVPGVAVALCFEGRVSLYQFGLANSSTHAPITPRTIFEIASITKVFTSTALAVEVLRGKMTLTDPVIKFFPAMQNVSKGFGQVTLLNLATHTSSLPRVAPLASGNKQDNNGLIRFLASWTPQYPIGTHYLYSNFAFGILGYAVGNAEGTDYRSVIRNLITGPLNMESTDIVVPVNLMANYAQGYTKDGFLAQRSFVNPWPGGGAIRSTSADMLKFLQANLDLFGPAELRRAMQFSQEPFFRVNNHLVMGLGWQRFLNNHVLIIEKNGGLPGFSSYIGMIPKHKTGIVLLVNKGKAPATQLGRRILMHLNE